MEQIYNSNHDMVVVNWQSTKTQTPSLSISPVSSFEWRLLNRYIFCSPEYYLRTLHQGNYFRRGMIIISSLESVLNLFGPPSCGRSYKITIILLSICLFVCHFGILRNGSLVFSDFLHDGR